MEKIEKLYQTIQNLQELGLSLPEDVLKKITALEEKIIRDDILPIIKQDIEPTLSQIKRELVLVVEYHPREGVSVALSRKAKISEISGAKRIEPYPQRVKVSQPVKGNEISIEVKEKPENYKTKKVTNHTKGLKVTFSDGTVVCLPTAIETLIEVLRRIGFERVAKLNLGKDKWPLVGKEIRPTKEGITWQHECDGWYIYSNTNNAKKKQQLKKISDALGLRLQIDDGKPGR